MIAPIQCALGATVLLLTTCVPGGASALPGADSRVHEEIRDYIDTIRIVDSHEHQRKTRDPDRAANFYTILASSYLESDLQSAGAPPLDLETARSNTLEENWTTFGPYLELSKNTSYYAQLRNGFQKLYGYQEPYFTQRGIATLSEQIAANYRNFDAWYARAFAMSNIEVWLVDPYWDSLEIELDERYSALIFDVDHLVWASANRYRLTKQENPTPRSWVEEIYFSMNVYRKAAGEGRAIGDFDDYLSYAGLMFDAALDKGAVGIKNSFAYVRSLHYENVPHEAAGALFDKAGYSVLAAEEEKAVQDYLFHWVIRKASEAGLPIQIHTGYLSGNGNTLENSRPADLNNLFLQYPKASFVIFHAGYPWVSQAVSLAKSFPNVSIDLVWLPQLSKHAAIEALEEILDMVPYNKVFWGGDCSTIEETVGSLESAKQVVAAVLASRVERGEMSIDTARDVALKIFRENALRVFRLEERLGRSFD